MRFPTPIVFRPSKVIRAIADGKDVDGKSAESSRASLTVARSALGECLECTRRKVSWLDSARGSGFGALRTALARGWVGFLAYSQGEATQLRVPKGLRHSRAFQVAASGSKRQREVVAVAPQGGFGAVLRISSAPPVSPSVSWTVASHHSYEELARWGLYVMARLSLMLANRGSGE